MIRRDVVNSRDNRVVKLALIAAAFALSLGFYAQRSMTPVEPAASAVAGQAVEAPAPNTTRVPG